MADGCPETVALGGTDVGGSDLKENEVRVLMSAPTTEIVFFQVFRGKRLRGKKKFLNMTA